MRNPIELFRDFRKMVTLLPRTSRGQAKLPWVGRNGGYLFPPTRVQYNIRRGVIVGVYVALSIVAYVLYAIFHARLVASILASVLALFFFDLLGGVLFCSYERFLRTYMTREEFEAYQQEAKAHESYGSGDGPTGGDSAGQETNATHLR
ncbi:MAG: hypothetical protein KatS3mg007_1447 [Thermoanaerobaculum sp.]|nr:MAG: hypothetical protein KatS3mg007_1447 [Thermoanaerobaculum sp.]